MWKEEIANWMEGWDPESPITEIAQLWSVPVYERCQCWCCIALSLQLHPCALGQGKKTEMWLLVPCSWFSTVSFHGNSLLRMDIAVVRVALEYSRPSSNVSSSTFVGKKKSLHCGLTDNWSLSVYVWGSKFFNFCALKDKTLPACWLLSV